MVSNRTLLFFMLGALAIMLSSTLITIITFQNTFPHMTPITAQATSDQIGFVQLNIDTSMSITIDDDIINFSGCAPGNIIYSDRYDGNSQHSCRGFVPDNITVRNDGGASANITLNLTNWGEAHGGSFLDSVSNSSYVLYKISNSSSSMIYDGGCNGVMINSWTNITNGSHFSACDELLAGAVYNSLTFNIGFFVPSDIASGSSELTISFYANPVS